MKKVFLLVSLLTICLQVFPNDDKKTKAYEIKLSLNRPFLPHDEEPKLGFGLEARKIWFPEKNLNLVSGIDLKNVNYSLDWFPCGNGCSLIDINYHAYYFSVPVLLRYGFGEKTKFYIEAGPEFNCFTVLYYTATQRTSYPISDGDEREVTDIWGGGNIFTLGLNIGAGLIVPIVGREYIIGCSYLNPLNKGTTRNNPHSHHFTVQLGTILK